MGQPFVGEIRMFAGNFPPAGWQFCDGQLVSISGNETLFQLIGTTYGGDGQSTFALPNLQSRVPLHMGQGAGLSLRPIAETAGVESVTLTTGQIPPHSHPFAASSESGTQSSGAGALLASGSTVRLFRPATPNQPMAATAITPAGSSQPHDNMQPYLCVNYIISMFGIFPSPS